MLHTKQLSRRSVFASAAALAGFSFFRSGLAQTTKFDPIADLDGGIEVRDYRLFPTRDVMRFLVEIHNTTSQPVDTPLVGVMLSHLPTGEGFGIAAPALSVMPPNTSVIFVGTAPLSLKSEEDWGSPDWHICNDLRYDQAQLFSELPLSFDYEMNPVSSKNLNILVTVTNFGDKRFGRFRIGGSVFDANGRPCGIVPTRLPTAIPPGVSDLFPIDIWDSRDYIGNPFVLDVEAEELSVELSLQPLPTYYQPLVCPIVTPWNQ